MVRPKAFSARRSMTSHRLVTLGMFSTLVCTALPGCAVKSRNFGTAIEEGSGGTTNDASFTGGGSGGLVGSGGFKSTGGLGGNPSSGGSAGGTGEVDAGQLCVPDAPACDGNRATTCSKDGTGYASGGMDCGTGRTCQKGACMDDPCKPGTDFCRGTEIRTCASDGVASTLKRTCSKTQYCDASSATCKAQVCTPNAHDCITGNVCAPDGSGWLMDQPPCDGTCTIDGTCQCIPGHLRCGGADGLQPQVCIEPDDAGPMWADNGAPCTGAADAACSAGMCTTKSIVVYYGVYDRTNNGMTYPATVSNVKLDKYEVTVGQFRRFVDAIVGGWRPMGGAGKHTHLNGGNGLANSGTDGGNEVGWRTSWSDWLPSKREDWNFHLTDTEDGMGTSKFATWTPAIGAYENRPINLVTWYDAYAYCIWSGGFLPSEAEWELAARGEDKGWKYPWGNTPEPPPADGSLAVFGCNYPAGSNGTCAAVGQKNIADVNGGPAIAGQSLLGHAHMAGNVWEWVLDWDVPSVYPASCLDCANTDPVPNVTDPARVHRGGDFFFPFSVGDLATTAHRKYPALYRDHYGGMRCARSP
jgi:sulfatase modifying factor 1